MKRKDGACGRQRRTSRRLSRGAVLLGCVLLLAACGSGGECGVDGDAPQLARDHPLLNPDADAMKAVPPDSFDVRFETTAGAVTVRVYRAWAPLGAWRFYNLARHGFYDGARFYRVIPGFVAQFGMSGQPQVDRLWSDRPLPDDPRLVSNHAGTLTYAAAGPDTRTTQLFFNYRENETLDGQGFAPIGRVIDGMGVLYRLYGEYGDSPPQGGGPVFGCMLSHGNNYLTRRFPELDEIQRAVVLEAGGAAAP